MKKYILTVIIFLIPLYTLQTQVIQIKLPDFNIDLKKIIKVDSDTYLALSASESENEIKDILLISKDGCKSWAEYFPAGIRNPVRVLYKSNNTIYSADSEGYIYKSVNIFSEWNKLEIQTGSRYINVLTEYDDYLIIGNRANTELYSAIMVYDLKKEKQIKIKQTIPGNAGVNSFYIMGGRVIAGTNNGFYYEDQPDPLFQTLNRATVNPEKEYPVGEYWYYPAKYTANPFYVYDKLLPVNEFKHLFVGDIQYSSTSGQLFAATYDGLYYSKHDGFSWGKYFPDSDGYVYEFQTNKDIKDYLSYEMISKIVPLKNYMLVETEGGLVFYSDYKNNKYDNWKQFTPPNQKKGEPAKVYPVDQNKIIVKTDSDFFLINDITKYLSGLK